MSSTTNPEKPSLVQIFKVFLYIGTVGFGGGLAILSLIQRYVVEKMKWLSEGEFADAVGVVQALPGVIAVNISCFAGFSLRSWRGATVAVIGMALPAFLSMLVLSEFYLQFRQVPDLGKIFGGMTPAIVSFIILATCKLGRSVITTAWDGLIALFAFVALSFTPLGIVSTVLILGGLGVAIDYSREGVAHGGRAHAWFPLFCLALPALGLSLSSLANLAYIFLKIGAFTFGGGYVMVPLLEREFVQQLHWLTPREFADSVALGQITPGPVIITATFIGYKVAGLLGGTLATLAVFLPSYLVTSAVCFSYEKFKKNRVLQAFLRGVTPGVAGMLAAATYSMGRTSIESWLGGVIAAITLILAWRTRIAAIWIILAAAGVGWIAG